MNLWAVTIVLLSILGLCNANLTEPKLNARTLGLADIPTCGLQCMLLTVPASGCGLADINCVCHNAELGRTLPACMLANCTMSETLASVKVQSDLCGFPQASKRTEMFMYTGIIYPLAILLVALRLAGKIVAKHISMDDWLVVSALILLALPVGCVLEMTKIGFGEHLWNLEDGDLLRILRFFWICSSFYVLVLAMIKVSLVFFYLEIFKTRQFRIAAYIVLGYIVLNSLVIFFLTIFSCTPISGFWDRDIKSATCLDVQALAYANSGSAILQDLILLILPLVFIRHLQMKRYRKIAVGLMFAFGTFGCIATIIRLRTLLSFHMSLDPTWDYVPVTIWTELELAAGFVCVSMPSIRILVMRAVPRTVKDWLSHVTQSSRSRSKASSKPSQEREWKKPSSWMNISRDVKDSGHGSIGDENMSSLWSRHSRAPSTHQNMRSISRRQSDYSEFDFNLTRPPFIEKRLDLGHEQMDMLRIPPPSKKARQSMRSQASRDSRITALPLVPPVTKIGLLPEGSFSDLDVTRTIKGLGRKWSRDDRV